MAEEATITEEVTTEATGEAVETVETAEVEATESTTTTDKAFVDAMLDGLEDEDVKSAKFWNNLKGKDANELAKYVKELNSFAGKKGDIPKEDASEEEWEAFYAKMGRPEDVSGYEFGLNDEFKELVGENASPFFEKAVEGFKEQSHKLGLDPKRAEELVDWYLDMVAGQTADSNKVMEELATERDTQLKNEWGDEYDGLYKGNQALLKRFGMTQEGIEAAEASGILKEPELAITLAKINSQFEDDPQIGHMQTKTTAGLQDQLAEANMEIANYIQKGDKVPPHIAKKRMDLMDKLGENL